LKQAKDDGSEVMVATGAISRAKLQSNHHHQQTNTQFLQAGCPSCRPTNSVKALKGNMHMNWSFFHLSASIHQTAQIDSG